MSHIFENSRCQEKKKTHQKIHHESKIAWVVQIGSNLMVYLEPWIYTLYPIQTLGSVSISPVDAHGC